MDLGDKQTCVINIYESTFPIYSVLLKFCQYTLSTHVYKGLTENQNLAMNY